MNGIYGNFFCDYIYKNRDIDKIGLDRKYSKYLKLKNDIDNGRNYVANKNGFKAIEMFKEGKSTKEIMDTLNIAQTTLFRYLQKIDNYKEILNLKKITKEDVIKIREIYNTSKNINNLYNLYSEKISISGLKKICRNATWKNT
jgi:hypothetical protein